jgi:hypothetical protein
MKVPQTIRGSNGQDMLPTLFPHLFVIRIHLTVSPCFRTTYSSRGCLSVSSRSARGFSSTLGGLPLRGLVDERAGKEARALTWEGVRAPKGGGGAESLADGTRWTWIENSSEVRPQAMNARASARHCKYSKATQGAIV